MASVFFPHLYCNQSAKTEAADAVSAVGAGNYGVPLL